MQNTFEFVCNLSAIRESDKFKPYECKTYQTGWQNRSLRFSATYGTNRIMLEIRGGCFQNGTSKVYTAKNVDKDGKRVTEKFEVAWNDRLKPEIVKQVAPFRRFVLDLAEPGLRTKLLNLKQAFSDGTVTDEMMDAAGCFSEEELNAKLNAVDKKRHEYISEWDFAEAVNKMLHADGIKDTKFLVRGNINISEYDGKFYTHYQPTRIYRAKPDTEMKTEATLDLVFGKGAVDDSDYDTKGKMYVNAYTMCYDGQRKGQIACPVKGLVIKKPDDEKKEKIAQLYKTNFTVKKGHSAYRELCVVVDVIDGAEVIPLTRDMLSENELQMLDLGMMTMEDIQRERGNTVYGDCVQEYVIKNFARGWLNSGAKDTVYTEDQMTIKPVEKQSKTNIPMPDDDSEDEEDDDYGI